ncbi:type III-B CRISPR module-associated Cmr3 family protein [Caldivirga maquilingensis]|uniref:Uncharacterized protein n=1 Tax=Caldivirga maquilingensis (strain ATCC 700844 / DSM 13496 / JCM 10307 / IC-167) TaxID=397948 RepID=A8M9C4_CALMQ|nr:type III-B CRISPR module-associated Cmr3 family protein [Caldivirga maquilingensis]ABW02343.1 hypothetical protein Cmaq_1519 [Caldivirga maquilingensis IC-167]
MSQAREFLELRIKPIEPLHLTAGPIRGIDLISATRASYAPLPTTVIGLLANIYYETNNKTQTGKIQDLDCGVEDLLKVKDEAGIEDVWGPLIVINGREHFLVENTLLPVETLKDYVELVKMDKECQGECYQDLTKEYYQFREISKVGIAINMETRTVRQGFMYVQKYTWPYRVIKDDESEPVPPGWYYKYIIIMNPQKAGWIRGKITWNIGGEGRQALIEMGRTNQKPPQPTKEAILLTPLIFTGEKPYVEVDKIDPNIGKIHGILTSKGPKIKITTTSLGYRGKTNQSENCRRPIYPALPPGTLVELKQQVSKLGLYTQLGYGATYPLPL